MITKLSHARAAVLRKLEAWLHTYRMRLVRAAHDRAYAARRRREQHWVIRWLRLEIRRHLSLLRKLAVGVTAATAIVALVIGALWWRLANGPIVLDVVTPWLTSAIEKNLGGSHHIDVGGTVLERDDSGRTALRLRDITVRNRANEVVATAPRAEIGISGMSLLLGNPRVVSFLLVGANMQIMIEPNGEVNIYAGGRQPFLSVAAVNDTPPVAQPSSNPFSLTAIAERGFEKNLAAVLGWVDGLGALGRDGNAIKLTGFDGYELTEVGVKNGSLLVDDARNARQWTFKEISLGLTRPPQGGVAFRASSESEDRSWSLSSSLMPMRDGHRALQLEARHVMLDHLLLATQLGDGQFQSSLPISADIRADIAPNGVPQVLRGRVTADGYLGDEKSFEDRIAVEAKIDLDWDITRGTLLAPVELKAGANRMTLYTQLSPPAKPDGVMLFSVDGGTVVLGPLPPETSPLVLNRVAVRIRHDLALKLIELERAQIATDDARNVGLAISGSLDYARDDPVLKLGLTGTQMNVSALKRLWPSFVAPHVRSWIMQHLFRGSVESLDIAINTPVSTLPANGPSMTDDAIAIDAAMNGAAVRPVDGLPLIRDADVTVHVTGRTATVKLGKGTADISSGRRLAVSNVLFEIPDMSVSPPPARVRFKLEGPVPAAAELMANEKLRDISGPLLDPATSRGLMTAQILLNLPLARELPKGAVNFNLNVDLTSFSAERMIANKKVEAALLRVAASNQAYSIKGDVKIDGIPAQLEYRKASGDTDAEVRIGAMLDDAARSRLGFDLSGAVSGAVPVKIGTRVGPNTRDTRYAVEADFTAARIDNLLPGWVKPPGRPTRATFTLVKTDQSTRFEDLAVDGSGAALRGTIEIDSNNDLQSANFTNFALSEGDKGTLKADRGPDGMLRVVMRSDIFDVRGFIKSSMSGSTPDQKQKVQRDLDVDVKISRALGGYGEAVRTVEFKMTRRGGHVRAFALNARIGRDTPLKGDMRDIRDLREQRVGRTTNGQVLYLETSDAGALFRFADVYQHMSGGRLLVVMDPPGSDQVPQEGILNIRDFIITGETQLEGVLPNQPNVPRDNIAFTTLNVDFTRTPGKLALRDGVVRGPVLGLTIDGGLDYQRDEVRLRGTFVPLYTLNNAITQIPIVGLVLGGGDPNSGVFGVTYEVVGTPGQPVMRINPASVLAPGILRKFFEFPATSSNPTSGVAVPGVPPRPPAPLPQQ